ncbi:hypothetical protein GF367_03340 [Candidatus Woesearchaeota archaeon]|nr:hypothetical protein [Candidatus Woesearchaeota archaeon]
MNTHNKSTGMLLVGITILLFMAAFVHGAGYAPVSILGEVVDSGPVAGAEVVLRTAVEDEQIVTEPVFTNKDGLFYSVLTVPDPSVVDVEIIMSVDDTMYIEVLRDAQGWQRYALVFDLDNEALGLQAPEPIVAPIVSDELASDLERIRSGEVGEQDALVEKYNLSIIEKPVPQFVAPVAEQPVPIADPERERPSGVTGVPLFWELFAVLLLVAGFFVMKYEIARHQH